MKKLLFLVFITGCIGIISPAFAEHTKYGPPFVTDDAGTEPKGGWEFAGWAPIATDSTGKHGYSLTLYQLALTYGITNDLEVFYAPMVYGHLGGHQYGVHEDSPLDHYVGLKYEFLNKEDFFMTLKFSFKDASRDSYKESAFLSDGANQYKVTLIASKYIRYLQIDANLGYGAFDNRPLTVRFAPNRAYSDEISYNLALTHPVCPGFLGVLEFDGKTDKTQNSITTHNSILDAYFGLKTWLIKDKIGLKAAIGKRVTEHRPDVLGAFGFTSYF